MKSLRLILLAFALTPVALPLYLRAEEPCAECSPAARVALSTNLLSDAFAIPEAKLQVAFCGKYSFGLGWHHAWWSNKTAHYYWQTYGGELFFRYHFGRLARLNTFAGHHVGVFGSLFGYDFKLARIGRQSPSMRTFTAGIEYGYSFPLTRRLNLDITVGAGYISSPWTKYKVECGHYICTERGHTRYWGPNRAEISLVWLLGPSNYNPPDILK